MRRVAFIVSLCSIIAGTGWVFAREWVDATGKHRIQAEFIEVVGEKVKLERENGKEVLVPIKALSDRDKNYLRKIWGPLPGNATPEEPLENEKKAKAKGKGPDTQKTTPEVSEEDRNRADELIEQAFHLLKLDPRGNAELISGKLREAGKLNPESIRAECVRGLLNLLVAFNPKQAHQNFTRCLARAPGNAAMMNNLAVTEVKMRRYRQGLDLWQKALTGKTDSPYIAHNVGRLLTVHNDQRLMMPPGERSRCAEMYATALTGKKTSRGAYDGVGWILMDFIEPKASGEEVEINPDLPSAVAGGGTGFVVMGKFIVTNRHVVDIDGASGVKVKIPNISGVLDAKVVAMSDTHDIAIVSCSDMKVPPVPVVGALPRRGSDVMVLGFPHFFTLGATIKSTRGAVTSLPGPATDGMMLLDAEINSGNSGGPIANNKGQIVAVTTAVYKPRGGTGGRYGAGIPIVSAMPFLRKHISGLQPGDTTAQKLEWPDVDAQVSRSTVLVLVEVPEDYVRSTGELASNIIPINDTTCPVCNGRRSYKQGGRTIECPDCGGVGLDKIIYGIRVRPSSRDPRRR